MPHGAMRCMRRNGEGDVGKTTKPAQASTKYSVFFGQNEKKNFFCDPELEIKGCDAHLSPSLVGKGPVAPLCR